MNHFAEPAASHEETGREFLVFRLGAEEYGIDILKVQEIRGYAADTVTRIANAPPSIKGVTNLRGIIVPIVDLRIHFRLDKVSHDAHTVVIILNLASRVVGIVVDGVSDVLMLNAGQISAPPELTTNVNSALSADCLTGLGTIDERMLILLDIEKLMAANTLA